LKEERMYELALFSGYGGGILGSKLLGWRTVCAVERDAYCAQILAQRQNDGLLEAFPIWSDVQSFRADNADCAEVIEGLRAIADSLVISGGFPCQDISAAGKGAGITGERSGMWKEYARIIGEIRPAYAFIENSPMLTVRGLDTVLSDLAAHGYDAEWDVLSARDVGANHKRERIWIVAKRRDFCHTNHNGHIAAEISASTASRGDSSPQRSQQACQFTRPSEQYAELANADMLGRYDWQPKEQSTEARLDAQCNTATSGEHVADTICDRWYAWRSDDGEYDGAEPNAGCEYLCENVPNPHLSRCEKQWRPKPIQENQQWQAARAAIERRDWWRTEPNVGRVVNGCAFRVERLKALGNAQVPLCAATAFALLNERLKT
jgi:DNA (cytosine-5)-methyltransferase 1